MYKKCMAGLMAGAMVLSPVYGLSIVVAAVAGALFLFGLLRNHGR